MNIPLIKVKWGAAKYKMSVKIEKLSSVVIIFFEDSKKYTKTTAYAK